MQPSPEVDLVVRAQRGDRDAFAQLYDQYSARIYDLCAHMLRDRDEAADATAEVFLAAAEHIAELRDPEKVTSWLYAIARNEVYRRSRQRSRETAVDPFDLDRDVETGLDVISDSTAPDITTVEPAASATLLREAALGLADRDRLVLELTLAGSLDGRALGDALGVSTDTAHQASHRMRERLARSVGALLVARQGREDCPGLQSVLAGWDGTFSVLWRKRVARHVDKCELCSTRHSAIPRNVLTGSFAAIPITWLHAPAWLRDRVLGDAPLPTGPGGQGDGGNGRGTRGHGGRHWKRDGFPPLVDARRRRVLAGVAAGLGVVALVLGAVAISSSSSNNQRAVVARTATTTTAGSSARVPGSTDSGTPGAADQGKPNATTSTTKPKNVIPPTVPATPATPAPDVTGPSLSVNVPSQIMASSECQIPPGDTVSASTSDPSGVTQVVAQFAGPTSGSFSLLGGPSTWSRTWKPPLDGFYNLTIIATDGRGNTSSTSRQVEGYHQIC